MRSTCSARRGLSGACTVPSAGRGRRLPSTPCGPQAIVHAARPLGRRVLLGPSVKEMRVGMPRTSMGRLTLNVLLSFAQFDREVIGERIRDKIAASKQKGMWMGGTGPLGYDVRD